MKIVEEWLSLALIQCSKCGKDISDKATKCIHCGTIFEERKRKNNKIFLLALLVFIILLGSCLYLLFSKDDAEVINANPDEFNSEKI